MNDRPRYLVSLVFALLIVPHLGLGQTRYAVVDLGTLGGTTSSAYAINDSGFVVGDAATAGGQTHAFLYKAGTMIDLGTLGGIGSTARGINKQGHVTGSSYASDGLAHAYLYSGGIMHDLGTFANSSAYGWGVNDSDLVVGYRPSGPRAFLYRNGGMIDIGSIGGDSGNTVAYRISNAGYIVGYSMTPSIDGGRHHAIMYHDGTMTDLGTFGGRYSLAQAINHRDQIVGWATLLGDQIAHTFLYENGSMVDLGQPELNPYGLNDSAVIVGYRNPGGQPTACILKGRVLTDLNTLIDPASGWALQASLDINNLGEIVGFGSHNGLVHAFLLEPPQFKILKPLFGQLLVAGTQDTVRWVAPGGLQLRIEVSFDDGTSYHAVDSNLPADSSHYYWRVPDTLSRRCRVRLIDINNESTYVVSDRFKIKGYQLTRFRSDSSYEAYRPDLDGWGFGNESAVMWPPAWWGQFNYQTGVDPYTGQTYPQEDPFDLARPDDFPDWPLFVKAFSVSQCYLNTSTSPPVYRPSALLRWKDRVRPWDGSCSGFAVTSLLDFGFEQAFLDSFPVGVYVHLHDLPVNDVRRAAVNQLGLYYRGKEHLDFSAQQGRKTPSETIQELKEMFLQEATQGRYLYISDPHGSSAHAVTPYQMAESEVDPGVYVVDVYDGNHPGETSFTVVMDSALETWEYNDLRWGGGSGMYLMDPVSTYLNHPVLQARGSRVPAASRPGGQQYLEIDNSADMAMHIADSNGGEIGFQDSSTFSTMTNAVPILPITSRFAPPAGYYVPARRYSIRMSAFTDSLARLSVYSDSVIHHYERKDASASQTDKVSCETTGLGLVNPDAQTKTMMIQSVVITSAAEKVMVIEQYPLHQNDSAFCGVTQHDHLRFVNIGGEKLFSVRLVHATAAGESRFLRAGIAIPANSSEEIVPPWADLGQQLVIYVDLGNNGTIDDTMFIGNTLGVGEQADIPKEFTLAQNYPNPFNPSTRIEYALPVRSRVTIRVYDILGQEVATLLDEERPAGTHVLQWNGHSTAGRAVASGVYFYRLEATAQDGGVLFSAVHKMIVLK